MKRNFTSCLPFAGGSALILAGTVPWARGTTNPLADASDNLGQSLLPLTTPLANAWCLIVGGVLVVAGIASVGCLPGTARLARRTMVAGAVGGLLTLDQSLLMVLGYLPMMVVKLIGGDGEVVDFILSPGLLVQVLSAGAAMALALQLLRGWRPASDSDDVVGAARRRTHTWTMIAIEAPLVYALSRILMFLQVPGFRGLEGDILLAGLGLAAAAIGGAWLTWGLVRPWGERFPRWMLGLAGRRVPVGLAVVPALVVAALVATASRAIVVGMISASPAEWEEQLAAPLIALPQLLWPLWAWALAMAALSYRERRRLSERQAEAHERVNAT